MVDVNFGFLCTNLIEGDHGDYAAHGIGLRGTTHTTIPARNPDLACVVQMKFTSAKAGPKTLGFHIMDLDGMDIVEFEDASIEAGPPLPGDFYSFDSVTFDLGRVPFPRFGEYTMIFRVDGIDVHRMSYRISQRSATTNQGADG